MHTAISGRELFRECSSILTAGELHLVCLLSFPLPFVGPIAPVAGPAGILARVLPTTHVGTGAAHEKRTKTPQLSTQL
jgi:hypothetical protein